MAGFFDVSPDPQMPDLPMPEAFHNLNAWAYSGNPYVSPAMRIGAGLGSDAVPPAEDVIIVQPPPKYQLFDTPGDYQYILVPPNPPPTKDDPTGMKRMMEFLGIKKDLITASFPTKADPGKPAITTPPNSAQQSNSVPGPTTASPKGIPDGPNSGMKSSKPGLPGDPVSGFQITRI